MELASLSLLMFHSLAGILRDFLFCCTELTRLRWRRGGEGGIAAEELTAVDAAAVAGRLGMVLGEEGTREGAVEELLERKEASEWELEEAFYVFDRNEDGFITAEELWNVMRRLGFEEGRRVEDCERMIRVFDLDGDGRINFSEFRRLMENSM